MPIEGEIITPEKLLKHFQICSDGVEKQIKFCQLEIPIFYL